MALEQTLRAALFEARSAEAPHGRQETAGFGSEDGTIRFDMGKGGLAMEVSTEGQWRGSANFEPEAAWDLFFSLGRMLADQERHG